jgi:lysylphosphatidylglycerol synthetase-like protein (DUF2156 family)
MNKRIERKEAWIRIFVVIITGIVLSIWKTLIWILSVVHWFIVVFTGKRKREIAEFCEYFNTTVYKLTKYMTFVSNERPFPFTKLDRMSAFK